MRGMRLAPLMLLVFLSTGCTKPPPPPSAPNTQNSRVIPLESIISPSPQFYRSDGEHKSYEGYLAQILARGGGYILPNVFLADAPDIDGAVAAASHVILERAGTDTVALRNQPNPRTGNHWLVAYLGIGTSSGPLFIVDKVTANGPTITFSYHKPKLMAATDDLHDYFYWVPLGRLDPGVYQLELFDTDADAVMLSRRVTVGK